MDDKSYNMQAATQLRLTNAAIDYADRQDMREQELLQNSKMIHSRHLMWFDQQSQNFKEMQSLRKRNKAYQYGALSAMSIQALAIVLLLLVIYWMVI